MKVCGYFLPKIFKRGTEVPIDVYTVA